MNKKLLIAFVVAIVLLAAGYWYWQSTPVAPTPEQANLNQVGDSVKALNDSVTQGVLPSLAVPDANPTTKTNPFSGLKTNPFGK
ncbi:hypothetical protein D4R51_02310 [bacterium]|nr:MAG: hypothetical protein D4R51_02310 [bacterium]